MAKNQNVEQSANAPSWASDFFSSVVTLYDRNVTIGELPMQSVISVVDRGLTTIFGNAVSADVIGMLRKHLGVKTGERVSAKEFRAESSANDALIASFEEQSSAKYRNMILNGTLGTSERGPSESQTMKDRKEAGRQLMNELFAELSERLVASGKDPVVAFIPLKRGKAGTKEENEAIVVANEQRLATFLANIADPNHATSRHAPRLASMIEAIQSARREKANGTKVQTVSDSDFGDALAAL